MPPNEMSFETYLQRGWQEQVVDRHGEVAVVLLSYHELIGHRPRMYNLTGTDHKLLNACAEQDFRVGVSTNLRHQLPLLEALIEQLRVNYSIGAADCIDVLLGSLIKLIGPDQLTICWNVYTGHRDICIEALTELLAAVTPRHTISILHCACLPTDRLTQIKSADQLIKVPCGGQTQLTKLFERMTGTIRHRLSP